MILIHTPRQLLQALQFNTEVENYTEYAVYALTVEGWTKIFIGSLEDCHSIIEGAKIAIVENTKCLTITRKGVI